MDRFRRIGQLIDHGLIGIPSGFDVSVDLLDLGSDEMRKVIIGIPDLHVLNIGISREFLDITLTVKDDSPAGQGVCHVVFTIYPINGGLG